MIYIFAPSYQTVLFSLHQFRLDEITYVTYNPAIKKFAEQAGIAVIYLEEQTDLSIKGYKDHKKLCLDIIKDWEGRDILFCFYCFDVWSLYLLYRLRKKNKVYFYNTDILSAPGFDESNSVYVSTKNNSVSEFFNEKYRKAFLRQKLLFFLTRFSFDLFEFAEDNFGLGISLRRIRKVFLPFKKQFDETVFSKNNQSILTSLHLPGRVDILFIDSGSNGLSYSHEVVKAIEQIVKKHNLIFIVKPHPSFRVPAELSGFVQADTSIPVEIIANIPTIVMGLASYSMVSIAQSKFTISLINLATFESNEFEMPFRKIISYGSKIHSPSSIEELMGLIREKFE